MNNLRKKNNGFHPVDAENFRDNMSSRLLENLVWMNNNNKGMTRDKNKESVDEFVANSLAEMNIDVDIEFCKSNNVKFPNHELPAENIDLFNEDALNSAYSLMKKIKLRHH